MEWFANLLRHYPELAIFLTLAFGFWIGKFKIKKFTLGTVTSVLLVGVLIGQLHIDIGAPLKSVFFLMFLFAVGYSVGPQFFRGLKKEGLPQVLFAVVMCLFCLLAPFVLAKIMGYSAGEAAGLLAGSQTISAVLGVAEDTINQLGIPVADKTDMINVMPVAYAVSYIFGTAGSAWIMSDIAPRLLGGIESVKKACRELEAKMGSDDESEQPGFMPAARPITFRAYKINNGWFGAGKTVKELEDYLEGQGRRLFVERVRIDGVIRDAKSDQMLLKGNEVVLSGRREFVIGEEDWIGDEVNDIELLDFPAETLPVLISRKEYAGMTVAKLRKLPVMHGVSIKSIKRAGINIPVLAATTIDPGDMLELVGTKLEVNAAADTLGYAEPPDEPDGYDFRRPRNFSRRCRGGLSDPFRRCTYQLEYEWRGIDCWIGLRLVAFQASDFRTNSGTIPLGVEQRRVEHVHRRCRYYGRTELCHRLEGGRRQPLLHRCVGYRYPIDRRCAVGKICL